MTERPLHTRRIPRMHNPWAGLLVPWTVRPEHRWSDAFAMLQFVGRERSGEALPDADRTRLSHWQADLDNADCVVPYDPESGDGWSYVPRRSEIDHDLIRKPSTP